MRTFISIAVLVLIAAGIIFGVVHWISSTTSTTPPPNTNQGFPVQSQTPQAAQNSFTNQIQNANLITLDKDAIVVGSYALQNWSDENKGGQALLEYQQGAWVLITLGGGAWDVNGLVEQGVPQNIAQELVAKESQ